jgi:carbon storage regulator
VLVLTRKLGQILDIGDGITVTVLEVRSGQVKLGIQAPLSVPIHRREITERIAREEANHG